MSGGGGGSKPSPVEKEQAKVYREELFPAASDLYNGGDTSGIYQGSRLARQSGSTLAGQQQALGAADNIQAGMGAYQDNFGRLLDTNVQDNAGLYMDTVNAENARQAGLSQELINQLGVNAADTFNQNILPQIQDRAQFAGQFGGTQQNLASGVAASGVQSALNQQIAQILQGDQANAEIGRQNALNLNFGQRESQLNRALNASGMAPSVFQSQLMPADIYGRVGANQDAFTQLQKNDAIQQYNAPRDASLLALNQYADIINQTPNFTPQSSGPDALQTGLGAAALTYGLTQ